MSNVTEKEYMNKLKENLTKELRRRKSRKTNPEKSSQKSVTLTSLSFPTTYENILKQVSLNLMSKLGCLMG